MSSVEMISNVSVWALSFAVATLGMGGIFAIGHVIWVLIPMCVRLLAKIWSSILKMLIGGGVLLLLVPYVLKTLSART